VAQVEAEMETPEEQLFFLAEKGRDSRGNRERMGVGDYREIQIVGVIIDIWVVLSASMVG
jgi:hypothetical protein